MNPPKKLHKMDIDKTIKDLKKLLEKGGKEQAVMDQLLAQIPNQSKKHNDLLALKIQFVKHKKDFLNGLITQEESNVALSKFINALLHFIDELTVADFQETDQKTIADDRIGKICFRIPPIMQVDKRNECRIWISFDKATILKEVQIQIEDELQDIRVSDTMGVELIDDSDEDAFKIKTYEEKVQPVEADLLTNWIFKVTPLKTGTFPLVLRITAVVEKNGKELKKSIILEETVNIVTELSPEVAAKTITAKTVKNFSIVPIYKPKGLTGSAGGEGDVTSKLGGGTTIPLFGKILGAAAIVGGLFFLLPRSTDEAKVPTSTTCIHEAKWEQIRQTSDLATLKTYLEDCPEGPHVAVVKGLIDSLDNLAIQQNFVKDSSENAAIVETIPTTTGTNSNKLVRNTKEEKPPIASPTPVEPVTPKPPSTNEVEELVDLSQVAHHPIIPACEDSQTTPRDWEVCTQKKIRDLVSKYMRKSNIPQEGSATITFVIGTKGNISNEKIDKTDNRKLAGVVLKVLKELPAFKPGRDTQGRLVRVKYTLPVRYR